MDSTHRDTPARMALVDLPAPSRRMESAFGSLGAFVRYLIAGLGSLVTDFSVYTLLVRALGLDPLIANLISRPLGGVTCFWLNRSWTFRSAGRVSVEFVRFWCVFGASLALTEGLLALFTKGIGFRPIPGKALAEAIAIGFNFLALKHWTFRRSEGA